MQKIEVEHITSVEGVLIDDTDLHPIFIVPSRKRFVSVVAVFRDQTVEDFAVRFNLGYDANGSNVTSGHWAGLSTNQSVAADMYNNTAIGNPGDVLYSRCDIASIHAGARVTIDLFGYFLPA
ncbi:MAG: hypothetical protein AUG51_07320 [Acidobacteria bacterium 13_1_20CM_3_53_8]|nr:MAG: hypothetical protein AUG51_07320 [Acidobacteria bacterium 13_1_20CM_3_53_8]